MGRTVNPMGRSRKPGNAYIVTEDSRLPGWRWEILKTYQLDGMKPYARAFCAVSSPYTWGSFDLGDTYVAEIGRNVVDFDHDVFPNAMIATHALFGYVVLAVGGGA